MKNYQKITLVGIVFFLFSLTSFGQANDAYSNDIRNLLKVNKTKESMEQVIPLMINQFKQLRPDIPANVWSMMEKEIKNEGLDDLLEKMIPIYKKHFTHTEIKELVAFYTSPIGKKLADKTPVMTQESSVIGQEWGQELGAKMAQKLKKQGY